MNEQDSAHACPPCCFCDEVVAYLAIPAVALAVARLRDEVTIAKCDETGRVRLLRLRRKRSIRKRPFERALDALAHGPLPLSLLVEDVYGPSVADPDVMHLRRDGLLRVLIRQAKLGRVVRVGHGVYALPEATEGMRHRTIEDCREALRRPPAGKAGWTSEELAERLDVSRATVWAWLRRLRESNRGLVAIPIPRKSGRGSEGFRYRVDTKAARAAAA